MFIISITFILIVYISALMKVCMKEKKRKGKDFEILFCQREEGRKLSLLISKFFT